MMFKKVLVLSPHTDDGELASGGTIARLVESGAEVIYVAFSAPFEWLVTECQKATKVLGVKETLILDHDRRNFPRQRQEILQDIYDLNERYTPDLVLTPSTSDNHQDHEVISKESIRIFKSCTLLGYEHPWNLIYFTENCVVPFNQRHLDLKLKSLMEYRSQQKWPYFKPELVKASAMRNGGKIKAEYAEVFEVIRFLMRIEQ